MANMAKGPFTSRRMLIYYGAILVPVWGSGGGAP